MRRNIFLWALYDFANSIVMIAFLFYFSQWLVIESHKPDWWYNAALIVSSVLFIAAAPFLARILDGTGKKLSGLRITTLVAVTLHLATALVTLFSPQHVLLATTLFTSGLTVYLLSFVYYTPMMNDLATESNKAFVSGLGMGANYVGQVLGLLAVLPFATGALYLFGAHGRAQALLPAVMLFALFSLPTLVGYREIRSERNAKIIAIPAGAVLTTLKQIFRVRNLALLIVGYFFFSDALLTFANNFPIYMEKVYAVSDATKTYLSAGILIFSALGSIIFGKLADLYGHKRTLVWLLVCWAVIFTSMALTPRFPLLVGLTLVAGFLFGPMWGVSRAMVGNLAPKDTEASVFGLYTAAERFATFIGPLTWSAVLASTVAQGVAGYSYAIFSMGVLIVIGLLFVRKIRVNPGTGGVVA